MLGKAITIKFSIVCRTYRTIRQGTRQLREDMKLDWSLLSAKWKSTRRW